MIASGTLYLFPVFGPQIKSNFGLSEASLSIISGFGHDTVYITGPLVGYFVDLYSNYPHFIILVASSVVTLGYVLLTFSLMGILSHSIPILAFYFVLVGFGG